MSKNAINKQAKISQVEVTTEKISGRGGLFFFLQYVENIGFYSLFEKHFGFLKASGSINL